MRIGRFLLRALGVLAVIAMLGFAVALWAYRDIPAAELEARYARPASKFIDIDGVRMHYMDEGSGPVVVLVHANFSNLLDWDPWVEALSDRYRVVRFDMTSHGLTGPDPTGDYTLERTLKLTERFIDSLGVPTVTLGGTSLGGTVAIHLTATHPERVERLILLSPGSLEGKERRARGGVPRVGYSLKYFLPRALPRFMLSSGFGDPARLPESLVDRWYDLWMREGQREAQLDRLSQYKAGDIEGLIRSLRLPVLLLWGELNTTAVFTQSQAFIRLLENAASLQFIAYPDLGHMALQEAGRRIGRDVRAWLDATPASGRFGVEPRTAGAAMPRVDSPEFCVAMQRRMAGTVLTGANTVFTDMASFRHSKPSIRPFRIYQAVTYAGARPIRASCKMKTAAHLRAVYGAEAAGSQGSCADMTRLLQAQAVAALRDAGRTEAADKAAGFVIDEQEPFVTGRAFLAEYRLSYEGTDGRLHLSSPGLFQDYDSWITPLLPKIVQGQSYCHVPTPEYLVALASGEIPPGTLVTTADDAAVTPGGTG
jgi:pimeloyl-ACP methyl ester carboxylesterase